MRLYSPVEITGNVNMIEKIVLGGTGTGDLPIPSSTREPVRHQVTLSCPSLWPGGIGSRLGRSRL